MLDIECPQHSMDAARPAVQKVLEDPVGDTFSPLQMSLITAVKHRLIRKDQFQKDKKLDLIVMRCVPFEKNASGALAHLLPI